MHAVRGNGSIAGHSTIPFNTLLNTPATHTVDAVHASITGDHIAKFMFTSGSTQLPKAAIVTHGMYSANMQQMNQAVPVLAEEPLVLVHWLPWNHTFGGKHNFGTVLYNGGMLYLDKGKPTPKGNVKRQTRLHLLQKIYQTQFSYSADTSCVQCY